MQVNGVVASDLAEKVNHGDEVLLDFELLRASPRAAVLLHKPYGSPATEAGGLGQVGPYSPSGTSM